MGSSTGNQDGGAGLGFDIVVANLHDESAFEDVPGFVIGVVEMAWSDQARRAGRGAGVSPFGDDEGIVGGAQGVPCKQWSDHWLIHGSDLTRKRFEIPAVKRGERGTDEINVYVCVGGSLD